MKSISKMQKEAVDQFQLYSAEFIASILEVYPENEILQSYNNRFHLLCQANPFKPVEYFYSSMYEHKQHILDKDIDFFLNIEQHISPDDDSLLEALQLKGLYERLNEHEQADNSETIFMYLKLLLFFTEQYYGL